MHVYKCVCVCVQVHVYMYVCVHVDRRHKTASAVIPHCLFEAGSLTDLEIIKQVREAREPMDLPLQGGDPKHTRLAFDKGSEKKTQVLALTRQELY